MKTTSSIIHKNIFAFALALTAMALPFSILSAHEGHDHGKSPAPHAADSAADAWKNAQASLKAIQAAAVAKQHEPIHHEQEKLVIALKQIQELGGGTDKARLEGAIKNAIAASEKVHSAADAKDFAKVETSLKTLESTMAMVEKQLAPSAK
ncbi:MAG TPA: hypothetical protein VM940_08385 [Chthoniobacterales bacterium]|jgi:hypothetical protein|nr:hypothetical protein [Chthoniobacterales bacterium]